jgi:hypothetical protein
METHNTLSTNNFTIEDLKKSVALIHKYEKEEVRIYDIPWFSKLMNKFGWHRKYEVLIFDSDKLKNQFRYNNPPNLPL